MTHDQHDRCARHYFEEDPIIFPAAYLTNTIAFVTRREATSSV